MDRFPLQRRRRHGMILMTYLGTVRSYMSHKRLFTSHRHTSRSPGTPCLEATPDLTYTTQAHHQQGRFGTYAFIFEVIIQSHIWNIWALRLHRSPTLSNPPRHRHQVPTIVDRHYRLSKPPARPPARRSARRVGRSRILSLTKGNTQYLMRNKHG